VDDKIILYGMSCSGKTTFAQLLKNHKYFCFDAFFHWHEIESLGLSAKNSLQKIVEMLSHEEKYVLDGWHLSDKSLSLIPLDAKVYVIYSDYDSIIKNYRTPIYGPLAFDNMYNEWYWNLEAKISRYIRNEGCFRETSVDEFLKTIIEAKSMGNWNKDRWEWT
jgi:GTPase SAR1 family protein